MSDFEVKSIELQVKSSADEAYDSLDKLAKKLEDVAARVESVVSIAKGLEGVGKNLKGVTQFANALARANNSIVNINKQAERQAAATRKAEKALKDLRERSMQAENAGKKTGLSEIEKAQAKAAVRRAEAAKKAEEAARKERREREEQERIRKAAGAAQQQMKRAFASGLVNPTRTDSSNQTVKVEKAAAEAIKRTTEAIEQKTAAEERASTLFGTRPKRRNDTASNRVIWALREGDVKGVEDYVREKGVVPKSASRLYDDAAVEEGKANVRNYWQALSAEQRAELERLYSGRPKMFEKIKSALENGQIPLSAKAGIPRLKEQLEEQARAAEEAARAERDEAEAARENGDAHEGASADVDSHSRSLGKASGKTVTLSDIMKRLANTAKKVGAFIGKVGRGFAAFGRVAAKAIAFPITALGKLQKAMTKTKKHGLLGNRSLGQFLGLIALRRAVSAAIRALTQGIKEGSDNLVQYSAEYNHSISSIVSSLNFLKNAWAVAFAPIINAVYPYVSAFVDMIATAMNAIGRFMAALTGKGFAVQAKKNWSDYAKSLDKTASSTGKANDAAEEYKKTVMSFDELHLLNAPNESSGGSGGGSGSGSGGDVAISDMFTTVEVTAADAMGNLGKKIHDAIKADDWTAVGSILTSKVADLVGGINWDTIEAKATEVGTHLAQFLNGAVGKMPKAEQDAFGTAIAGVIKTAIGAAFGLFTNIEYAEIGTSLAGILNSAVANITDKDVGNLGTAIGSVVHGAALAITNFFNKTHFTEIGTKVRGVLNSAIGTITGSDIGGAIASVVRGGIAAGAALLKPSDDESQSLGTKLGDLFNALFDPNQEGSISFPDVGAFIATALNGITVTLTNFALTADFDSALSNLVEGFNTFVTTWDAAGMATGLETLLTKLDTALGNIPEGKWEEFGKKIGELLSGVDWGKHLKAVAKAMATAIGGIFKGFTETEAGSMVAGIAAALVTATTFARFSGFATALSGVFSSTSFATAISGGLGAGLSSALGLAIASGALVVGGINLANYLNGSSSRPQGASDQEQLEWARGVYNAQVNADMADIDNGGNGGAVAYYNGKQINKSDLADAEEILRAHGLNPDYRSEIGNGSTTHTTASGATAGGHGGGFGGVQNGQVSYYDDDGNPVYFTGKIGKWEDTTTPEGRTFDDFTGGVNNTKDNLSADKKVIPGMTAKYNNAKDQLTEEKRQIKGMTGQVVAMTDAMTGTKTITGITASATKFSDKTGAASGKNVNVTAKGTAYTNGMSNAAADVKNRTTQTTAKTTQYTNGLSNVKNDILSRFTYTAAKTTEFVNGLKNDKSSVLGRYTLTAAKTTEYINGIPGSPADIQKRLVGVAARSVQYQDGIPGKPSDVAGRPVGVAARGVQYQDGVPGTPGTNGRTVTVTAIGTSLDYQGSTVIEKPFTLKAKEIQTNAGVLKLMPYASGGIVNTGEVFLARESGPEMVGRIGRKTAVANNDQIVEGISSAVTAAMMAVLSQMNTNNNQTVYVESVLKTDDETLYRSVERGRAKARYREVPNMA